MSYHSTSDGARGQFTILQLLVAIGIIGVLLAIAGPIILNGNRAARDQTCANNLVQIGKAYVREMKVTSGRMQVSENWPDDFASYLGDDPRVFHCPEDDRPATTVSYGMNNRANLLRNGEKIVLLDYQRALANYVGPPAPEGQNWRDLYDDWPSLNAPRHGGRMNVLYRDGRVHSMAPVDVDPFNCLLYVKHWKPARSAGLMRNCGSE